MNADRRAKIHDLDVTVWVGKRGLAPVVTEVADQLADRDLLKVKFLRAARAKRSTDELAVDLADQVGAQVVETRGNTAVLEA